MENGDYNLKEVSKGGVERREKWDGRDKGDGQTKVSDTRWLFLLHLTSRSYKC